MTAFELTRRPTTVTGAGAGVAAAVAVAAVGSTSLNGLAFGAVGASLLALGLVRGWRSAVDVGCLLVFFGVVAGGLETDAVEVTMIATVATVVAWDLGQGSIDLGEQLGREAATRRLEAVHVVSSLLVGLLAATVGYAVFVFGTGGQPVMVVVLLLLAACLVTIGLGTNRATERRRR